MSTSEGNCATTDITLQDILEKDCILTKTERKKRNIHRFKTVNKDFLNLVVDGKNIECLEENAEKFYLFLTKCDMVLCDIHGKKTCYDMIRLPELNTDEKKDLEIHIKVRKEPEIRLIRTKVGSIASLFKIPKERRDDLLILSQQFEVKRDVEGMIRENKRELLQNRINEANLNVDNLSESVSEEIKVLVTGYRNNIIDLSKSGNDIDEMQRDALAIVNGGPLSGAGGPAPEPEPAPEPTPEPAPTQEEDDSIMFLLSLMDEEEEAPPATPEAPPATPEAPPATPEAPPATPEAPPAPTIEQLQEIHNQTVEYTDKLYDEALRNINIFRDDTFIMNRLLLNGDLVNEIDEEVKVEDDIETIGRYIAPVFPSN